MLFWDEDNEPTSPRSGSCFRAAGRGTAADAIIGLAGARNVASSVNGYRPVGDEAVVELAPEVIIGMHTTADNAAHDLTPLLAMKGVQATPAGAARRVVLIDPSFGPRAPENARGLMRALYPEIDAPGSTR